jgi:uncharacterized protein YecT (DUF1311 family)
MCRLSFSLHSRCAAQSVALALCLALSSSPGWSIDNPERPDELAIFVQRDEAAQAAVLTAETTSASLAAGRRYQVFLESELSGALRRLSAELSPEEQRRLVAAHRRWLKFREQENHFIDLAWSPSAFGSSAGLSRQAHRAALTRDRIRSLLAYMKDRPASR